jgi:hypothetical protein
MFTPGEEATALSYVPTARPAELHMAEGKQAGNCALLQFHYTWQF